MKRIFLSILLSASILSIALLAPGCKRASVIPAQYAGIKAPIALLKKDIDLVFVQENKRQPAHILYQRQDRYAFIKGQTEAPFKLEMVINPLMRNPSVIARVEKGGKTVREFMAKKTATSVLSENKTSWSPARTKLALLIPYVAPNEVVVVTTAFEWMDIRWLQPLMMQEEDVPTLEAKLTVDVPYGITMHFKAAKDRARMDYVPESSPRELSLWTQDDNRSGLGMRYVWKADLTTLSAQQNRADALQVLLSFESPAQNDAGQRFDSWAAVANYFYKRIDRYDMPSNEINSFVQKETRDLLNEEDKIEHIVSFLKNQMETRSQVGSFQEQDLQPATRTFARRFGSPSDIAILGKSLFTSIGVEADLVAAADKRFNPELMDFYSPALFSSIILAYKNNGVTHYLDPEAINVPSDQLQPNRQGQLALLLRQKNGTSFSLPYDNAQKNLRTYSYQLWLTDEGVLEGEYSIDLSGFEAQHVKREGREKLRAKGLAELEAHLYGMQRTDFALDSVEYFDDNSDQGLRVAGLIKPRLLFKNSHGGFDLKLEKIIEPALLALNDAHGKGFSSTTKIALFIGLPQHYVVENLPSNIHISIGGVEGRFFAEASAGQLIVEGIAMLSLPLKPDTQEKISKELEAIKIFGNQSIAIHDEGLVKGAQNASEEPPSEENS